MILHEPECSHVGGEHWPKRLWNFTQKSCEETAWKHGHPVYPLLSILSLLYFLRWALPPLLSSLLFSLLSQVSSLSSLLETLSSLFSRLSTRSSLRSTLSTFCFLLPLLYLPFTPHFLLSTPHQHTTTDHNFKASLFHETSTKKGLGFQKERFYETCAKSDPPDMQNEHFPRLPLKGESRLPKLPFSMRRVRGCLFGCSCFSAQNLIRQS